MSTATLDAPAAPSAVENTPPDYAGMAESICNYAASEKFWADRNLTTYEFRYDARRCNAKEALAQKYRSEIETYLPYFEKTHGLIHLNNLPQFLKECAACFSYSYALLRRNSTALCFDNDKDKLWAKRMEIEAIQERIEELQDELNEAEDQEAELEREIEAAEKAEEQKGNQS